MLYKPHISLTLSGSSTMQPFTIEIHNRMMFNFYPGQPNMCYAVALFIQHSTPAHSVILLYNCPTSREGLLHCSLEALEHLLVPPRFLGCRDDKRRLFQLPLLFLKGCVNARVRVCTSVEMCVRVLS